jgi:histidine ammonia-lyase
VFKLTRDSINLSNIFKILKDDMKIELGEDLISSVLKCRQYLEAAIEKSEKPIYGVNTGFGSLCDTSISNKEISKLQVNLVISHACGAGDYVPVNVVRTMLLLKIINLSLGNSGIRLETLQNLIQMFNRGISPVIYELGSLGASGDLSPLAHMSLPLIHRGEVWYKGEIHTSEKVMKENEIPFTELGAKEGLALLNGTQFMSAYSTSILMQLEGLLKQSDIIASASIDAYDGSLSPFQAQVHEVRSHDGQVETAKNIREILKDSEIANGSKSYVQDPYSFRCIPQVHGASRDAIKYVYSVVEKEIQSVTDNPMVFPDDDMVISAGNFHGQPLALSLDFLAIALAEMASISERRTYKLISGQRNLSAFLSPEPGINSGFMIPQYTAASIVSQNKQLCTPASVDTIDSSNGQEDHVSMGANAAVKCLRVLMNYKRVMAIELMNASQALHFRLPLRSSSKVEAYLKEYRVMVPFQEKDEEWHLLMRKSEEFIEGKC